MTTATTAIRDAADTIRDAAETGIQSIGGLLDDAKSRVEAVHMPKMSMGPKVTISRRPTGRRWLGWVLVVVGAVAVVAVLKSRSTKTSASSPAEDQRESVAASSFA